jgi:hypothetical protein
MGKLLHNLGMWFQNPWNQMFLGVYMNIHNDGKSKNGKKESPIH